MIFPNLRSSFYYRAQKPTYKILFYCTYIFLVSNYVIAQYPTAREKIINIPTFDDRLLHYGYFCGSTLMTLSFLMKRIIMLTNLSVEVQSKSGFNVGLIGDLELINTSISELNQVCIIRKGI